MEVNSIGSGYDPYDAVNGVNQNKQKPQFNGQKPQPPDIDSIVSKMTSELGLNDNQMIDLKQILQRDRKAAEEDMKASQGQAHDKKTMDAKMKSNMEKLDNSIKSILSDEQLQKFNAILSQRNSKAE